MDTVVVVDGRVLGKARDRAEARAYLRLLAGRKHECTAASALVPPTVKPSGMRDAVTFRSLDDESWHATCARRVARPRRRLRGAGAGSTLVTAVDGDYFNVVGLPVTLLVDTLARLGVAPLSWTTETRPA